MKKEDSIIFDLDDVIVKESFNEILKEFLQKKEIKVSDFDFSNACRKYYYIEKEFLKNTKSLHEYYEYLLNVNIYDYGVVDEKAVALIEKLSKICNVFIATSPIIGDHNINIGIIYKIKYEFLIKIFPFLNPENFIICGNKSVLSAKYIIDDRLKNLSSKCDIRILYTAKHNEGYSLKNLYQRQIIRISDMDELEKCIFAGYSLTEMRDIILEVFKTVYEKYLHLSIHAIVDEDENKILEVYINETIDSSEKNLISKYLEKRLGQDKVEINYDMS